MAGGEFRRLVEAGKNPFEVLAEANTTTRTSRRARRRRHTSTHGSTMNGAVSATATLPVPEEDSLTIPLFGEESKEALPFLTILAMEDLPGTPEAAAKMHALYEQVIGVCRRGQEQAEDAVREKKENPSCKSVLRLIEEVVRYTGVTMATAAVYVVTNLPAKFDAANAAIINILVNNIYLKELFDDIYGDLHHAYQQFQKERCCKASCAAFCKAAGKALLAILSITGAVGSSVAPLQGMRVKIEELGYEGSLRQFLLACNYANLGINGLLYFYPLYKTAISRLESSDNPALKAAVSWILKAFEKAKNTEDPDAQKELLQLIGGLDYTDQTTLEDSIILAYAERKTRCPVLFAKLERETSAALSYHEDRSWCRFFLDATYYLVPAATSTFVGVGNALALTMATRVGVQYLLGIDVTEWAAVILTSPDSYFNIDSVDRGIYRGLDFLQALYYRACRVKETGGEGKEIARIASLVASLSISIGMAIRSVSTITEIVESGGLAEKDWRANPVSSFILLAPEEMQATLTAAFTTGAFFINFKSVHIILHWALEGIRSLVAPTEYDRLMATFSEFESLVGTLNYGTSSRRTAEFAARTALLRSRTIDGKVGAITINSEGELEFHPSLVRSPAASVRATGAYGGMGDTHRTAVGGLGIPVSPDSADSGRDVALG